MARARNPRPRKPKSPARRPPRGFGRFSRREVTRALRAAVDAGKAVERVDINPATGTISVVIAKPAATTPRATTTWKHG